MMNINYQVSFKNDLSKIMKGFGDGSSGVQIAESVVHEVKKLCSFITSIRNKSDFVNLLMEKCSKTKIFPRVYRDNGCQSSHSLFFECRFDVRGVFAVVGFYLPSMFISETQREEMCMFTTQGESKKDDNMCIEFYFAVADSPELP